FEPLFAPGGEERRSLHRPDARADANGPEIAGQRLAHGIQRRIRIELSGVEAAWVAGLGQKLSGLAGIVWGRIERERELEGSRNNRAGQARGAERLGLVHGLAIERQARRLPDT